MSINRPTQLIPGSIIVYVDIKNRLTLSDVILAWWLQQKGYNFRHEIAE